MMIRLAIIILVISALAGCSPSVVFEGERVVAVSSAGAVNINTATADELERLNGVGRATAENVIAYRTENGAFRRVEHLMLVRGISERRFAELRPFVTAE